MTARIEMIGLSALIQEFGGFTPALTRELRRAQLAARRLIITDLRTYPPPPPGSTYQRTGALGRGWAAADAVPITNDTQLVMENAVPYAGDVQGETQAAMHRGRWETVDEVQQRRTADVQRLYAEAALRVVETIARQ